MVLKDVNQITNPKINLSRAPYLPSKLTSEAIILICHGCNTHLSSKKTAAPTKAYGNNSDPGKVSDIKSN